AARLCHRGRGRAAGVGLRAAGRGARHRPHLSPSARFDSGDGKERSALPRRRRRRRRHSLRSGARLKVIFYYDIVCPFAYLASTQIESVCKGTELHWQPILLGGLLKSIGNPEPMRSAPPAKAYMNLLDAQRWAEHRGVPLVFPPGHPRRTVEAMRLCTAM